MTNFSEIPWIAAHIDLYKTDPEKAHHWDSSELGGPGVLPTLLLTTKGRKTGEPRSAPLIYGEHPESVDQTRFVIIASKGGMPSHPIWFLNLQAEPVCEIQVGANHYRVKASVIESQERQVVWDHMAEIYPPYLEYQKSTDRKIPVVVLDVI